MRLFIAIEIDDDVRQRLAEAQRLLAAAPCKVKWVEPRNLHLTLKFLGEVPDHHAGAIADAMTRAARDAKPFEMKVAGVGTFPPKGVPRVVWAGAEAVQVRPLQQRLEAALEALGHEREKRAFHPHLTLGRVKGREGSRELRALMERLEARDFGTCRVGEVVLMQSTLSPAGPTYSPLHHAPLGRGKR